MKNLKKVIIPIAGLGLRMLPATKAIPKELFPLAGKPVIHYVVDEALKSGFSEIIFVTHESKKSVEGYFKVNTKLESTLREKKQNSKLNEIKEISNFGIKIGSVLQKNPKGLGHAILQAKTLIKGEPFAVMLPDMILDSDFEKENLALMKKNFETSGESSILLGKVEKSDVKSYGIAKLKNKIRKNNFFPLGDIIEKPNPNKAPSNLFVAGRYIFENEIFNFLEKEKPDSSGEIQLTGAISNFLKSSKPVNGHLVDGQIYDCGSNLGYQTANLALSFKSKSLKKEIKKFLKNNLV